VGRIVSISKPFEKMPNVGACRKHSMDDAKISNGRGVDVKDGDPLGPPQRDEVETIQAADNADHMNIIAPIGSDAFIVSTDLGKLTEGAILASIISPIEYVLGMIVVHLAVKRSRRF